jgi:hypothetical protein
MFLLIIVVLFGCSIEDFLSHQITQYIAVKEGETWKLSHKIVYKVYANKQEVIYWFKGSDDKERSQLYKMRKCIVADSNNWEGEMEYSPIGVMRVELVNGKYRFDGVELTDVGWWKWNLDEQSFQNLNIINTTWCVWHNDLVRGFAILSIVLLASWGMYKKSGSKINPNE